MGHPNLWCPPPSPHPNTHLLVQDLQWVGGPGPQVAVQQSIPCQNGARPQHEGEEQVGMDVVTGAPQAPAGMEGPPGSTHGCPAAPMGAPTVISPVGAPLHL